MHTSIMRPLCKMSSRIDNASSSSQFLIPSRKHPRRAMTLRKCTTSVTCILIFPLFQCVAWPEAGCISS